MPNYLVIKNGTIITHDKTIYNMDILIEDQKIIEIGAGIETDHCTVINASDMYVIPGLVDMHCDICDPGYDYKEDFQSAGESAINGGYTSLTLNPLTDPVVDNKAIAEYVISKAANECPVNVYPYGSLTRGGLGKEIAEIGEMQIAGIVAVSDGDMAIQDSGLLKNLFLYCSMFDMPVITHCEDTALSDGAGINDGAIAARLGLTGAPFTAETAIVARNILLAEEYGVHLHITHVSTKRSIDLIKLAKKKGMKISAETSPHYFTLDENVLLDYNCFAKVNPPLRQAKDIAAIIKGIAEGTIDVISSDHKPNTIDSKDVEFELASFGISSLETALSLSYTKLVHPKVISMNE